ncbi:MAG: helix-turn-helix domain-containing protein [Tepidamorphaceae bacterium]
MPLSATSKTTRSSGEERPQAGPRLERHCSVRKTVEIVLDSWTFLVVREAFFGVRRFDKFQSRLGVPRQTLSSRLAMLVENGILFSRKGVVARGHEYLLTKKGKDLFSTMLSLMEFGDKWLTGGEAAAADADPQDLRPYLSPGHRMLGLPRPGAGHRGQFP